MELLEFVSYLQLLDRAKHRVEEKPSIGFSSSTVISSLDEKFIQIQTNLLNLSDNYFQQCFRLPKLLVLQFIREMRKRTFNNCADSSVTCSRIPFDLRLLATISFLVHGHLDLVMSLDIFRGLSRSKIMRCVSEECKKIVLFLTPSLVRFPYKPNDIGLLKSSFLLQFGLPGVVGVLDSFVVNLKDINAEQSVKYRNARGQTSVKVQVICDQMYRFFDVNPRFPGASADIYVWKHSHIRPIMQNLYAKDGGTWLIADRGYRLDSFVINPYRNAVTGEQKKFNGVLKDVSGVLDKAIALLKARFRCLNGVLPFNHTDCSNIITACVTLHNFIIVNGYSIEDISYSIPMKNELKNARNEDYSIEGNVNREFLTEFLVNEKFRDIYAKAESSFYSPPGEATIIDQ